MNDVDDSLVVATEETMVREIVYRKLKRAILNGRFLPGERLVERDLSKLMRVSRTPIREAFRQLEREYLVKTIPYKGPSVADLTGEEARQLFELRAALEGVAARFCAERATEEIFEKLQDCLERSRAAADAGEVEDLLRWNTQFHELVAKGAGNQFLEEHLVKLRQRILLLRSASMMSPVRRERMLLEHQGILEHIRHRRSEEARDACERHVLAAGTFALREKRTGREVASGQPDATLPDDMSSLEARARRR